MCSVSSSISVGPAPSRGRSSTWTALRSRSMPLPSASLTPIGLRAYAVRLPGPLQHGPLDWYGSFAPRRLLQPDPHTGVPSALPCAHPRFAGFSPHPGSRSRPHPDHSLQAQAFAPRPVVPGGLDRICPTGSRTDGCAAKRVERGTCPVTLAARSAALRHRSERLGARRAMSPAGASLRPETSCAGGARPNMSHRKPHRRLRSQTCGERRRYMPRHAGGAQRGSQAPLGAIPAVTASRGM